MYYSTKNKKKIEGIFTIDQRWIRLIQTVVGLANKLRYRLLKTQIKHAVYLIEHFGIAVWIGRSSDSDAEIRHRQAHGSIGDDILQYSQGTV